jgi:hypothetical protein
MSLNSLRARALLLGLIAAGTFFGVWSLRNHFFRARVLRRNRSDACTHSAVSTPQTMQKGAAAPAPPPKPATFGAAAAPSAATLRPLFSHLGPPPSKPLPPTPNTIVPLLPVHRVATVPPPLPRNPSPLAAEARLHQVLQAALISMNDDANAAAAAAAQLEQQLALFTADNAAVEAYCSSVSTHTRQLAEFEAEAQAQLPVMQRLLSDLDAVLLLVLQGGQNMEISSSSDTAVHLATEAAANCCCSAGLSSQAAIMHMLQGGTISLQQYESHRTPSTKCDISCRYLGCVRVLARRKFQAKFILSAGGRRQAAPSLQ